MSRIENFTPNPRVAYAWIVFATFLWGLSVVISRGVHDVIPPLGMSFWRWSIGLVVLLPLVWRELGEKWPLVKQHAKMLVLMGFLQVGSSTVMLLAVNFTTAVNATIMNAALPVVTIVPAWLITRDRVTLGQSIGIVAALLGIFVMAAQGQWQMLASMDFNLGDIFAFLAVVGWSLYGALLHRLPAELGLATTLFYIILTGSILLAPFYIAETVMFKAVPASVLTVVVVLVLGIFVSVGSILIWNACIRAIGPNRTSIFINLVPIFGIVLAIIFLGESLYFYHLAGGGMVFMGILLVIYSTQRRKRRNKQFDQQMG